jgi:hypothetical protein
MLSEWLKTLFICSCWQLGLICSGLPAIAETVDNSDSRGDRSTESLDLPPRIIEDSPVLQKWLEEIPNVLEDIQYDPSFKTRLGLGVTWFNSDGDATGVSLSLRDLFIQRTGLTLDADYYTATGDRLTVGADVNYFLLPLGNYLNFAPTVGYRYLQSEDFSTDGINLGLRLMLALSRTGAGDISLTQSFISPGGNEEVGIISLSAGYGITPTLRLSGDVEWQNSPEDRATRLGINLEWLF